MGPTRIENENVKDRAKVFEMYRQRKVTASAVPIFSKTSVFFVPLHHSRLALECRRLSHAACGAIIIFFWLVYTTCSLYATNATRLPRLAFKWDQFVTTIVSNLDRFLSTL